MLQIRVLLYSSFPAQNYLEFELIFPDNCQKHYKLTEYDIRAYRGLNERRLIEQKAIEYLDDIGEPSDNISLLFL